MSKFKVDYTDHVNSKINNIPVLWYDVNKDPSCSILNNMEICQGFLTKRPMELHLPEHEMTKTERIKMTWIKRRSLIMQDCTVVVT